MQINFNTAPVCILDSASGYRRLLREEVTSGRLDAASSKAAVLQQLCDRLKFNPEAAGALHRSLYRQKMDDVLKNHNKITGMSGHTKVFQYMQ